MKIKLIALVSFVLLSVTILSCDWFGSRSSQLSDEIIGKWKIDSVAVKNDSSNVIGNLLFALALKDSNQLVLDFRKDSVFTMVKDSAVEKAAYQIKEKRISIDQNVFTVESFKDSVLHLSQTDSTEIFLKKF